MGLGLSYKIFNFSAIESVISSMAFGFYVLLGKSSLPQCYKCNYCCILFHVVSVCWYLDSFAFFLNFFLNFLMIDLPGISLVSARGKSLT